MMAAQQIGAYRRRRWLATGTAITLLLAAVLVMLWASRTRWQTYTFPADPKTGMAVAIDYPDDWAIDTQRTYSGADMQGLAFRLREPNSLVRWWRAQLRKNHSVKSLDTNIRFDVSDHVSTTIGDLETSWAQSGRSFPSIFHKVDISRQKHILGPELDVNTDFSAHPNGYLQRARSHQVIILLQARGSDPKMMITGNCLYFDEGEPGIDGRFREVVARIHLERHMK